MNQWSRLLTTGSIFVDFYYIYIHRLPVRKLFYQIFHYIFTVRLLYFAQWNVVRFIFKIISGSRRSAMTINRFALGDRIYNARIKRNLTQNDLAELAGISNTYLSHIENGTKRMSMDTFVDILNALGTTADELLIDSIYTNDLQTRDKLEVVLNGCTVYEKKVILEIASALKDALRKNRNS